MSGPAPPGRLRRVRVWGLRLLGGLGLACLLIAWSLLGTSAGARWVLGLAVPSGTEFEAVDGRLLGPLELRGVSHSSPSVHLGIDTLRIEWHPIRLLRRVVDVSRVKVAGVRVRTTDERSQPRGPAGPPSLTLPLLVNVRQVDLRRLVLLRSEGDTTVSVGGARLAGAVGPGGVRLDSLRLRTVAVGGALLEGRGEGEVGGASPHPLRGAIRWSGRLADGRAAAGSGAVAGDAEAVRVEHHLTAPLAATLEGHVRDVFGAGGWSATLRVPEVALATLDSSLPELRAGATLQAEGSADSAVGRASFTVTPTGEETLRGELAVTWRQDVLVLDSATVHIPSREGLVTARGSLELGTNDPQMSLRAEWSEVGWPLSGAPSLESPRGRLAISGRPTGFELMLDASMQRIASPTNWRVDGKGARTGDTLRATVALRTEVDGAPPVRSSLRGALVPGGVRVEELLARVDGLPTEVRIRGEVRTAEGVPRADLRVTWSELRWPLSGEARLTSPEGSLDVLGDTERFRVSANAAIRAEPLPPGRWRAEVTGGLSQGTLQVGGEVDALLEGIGEVLATGSLSRTRERILVPDLVLRTPASAGVLGLQGELRPDDDLPIVALHADWRNLAWPASGESEIRSVEGAVDATRRGDRLHLTMQATLHGGQIPRGTWFVAGSATPESLVIDTITAGILGGRLVGEASARRDSVVAWSAALRGGNLDPSHVRPAWPGDLQMALTARGVWGGAEPLVVVDELSLEGELRERPFRTLVRGALRGAELRADTVFIRSGSASVSASAVLADDVEASWSLDAPDLMDLFPEARGRLAIEGRAAGPRTGPRIRATARGSRLAFGDGAVDSLEVAVTADLSDAVPSEAAIVARGLRAGPMRVDSARLDASGWLADHQITVHAVSSGDRLVVGTRGGVDGTAWRGSLNRLGLESTHVGTWEIGEPAALFIAPDSASLETVCWTGRDGQLCGGGRWTAEADVHWGATGSRVPLALLSPVLPPNLALEGSVDFETSGHLVPEGHPNAELRLEARSAALRYRLAGQEERRPIEALHARALADVAGVRGDAELRFADGDHFRLEAHTDPAGLEQRNVRARLTGDLQDRGLTEVLSRQMLQATRGHLVVDLTAAGALDSPTLEGSIRLEEAGAIVPSLGIRIAGLELETRRDAGGPDGWLLSGSAISGGGAVGVEGSFRLPTDPAGWALRARLTGQDFEAYRTSLGHILLSPDLRIAADETGVEVEGELGVPVGRITAARAPTAVPAAPDVRVLGAHGAADSTPFASAALPVSARVRVSLGREVLVDAEGLRAELEGELTVVTEPGRPPVGNGTLEVRQGSYSAYGQRLTIDRGRIVFVQSPLDDPGLDLRIVRESRGVTARMDVTGTVRRPRIALSSEPSLADDEILAYLLLGKPLNQLSQREGRLVESVARALGLRGGNLLVARLGALFGLEEARIETEGSISDASLVLGKQVLSRVQVDYAIGLFGTADVLRIRYLLGRGWSIQTERGREMSVDLIYEIGR